jgi:hypothetical protein
VARKLEAEGKLTLTPEERMSSSPSRARSPRGCGDRPHRSAWGGRPRPCRFPMAKCCAGPAQFSAQHTPVGGGRRIRSGGAAPWTRNARRRCGRRAGSRGAEARAKFEEQLARERSAVAKALADFRPRAGAYYRKIEPKRCSWP